MKSKLSSHPENRTEKVEIVGNESPTTEALPSPIADTVGESKDDSKDVPQNAGVSISNSKKRSLSEPAKDNEPSSKKSRESLPASSSVNGELKASRFPSPPGQAAIDVDKENWQGFCDIESDPAYFSVILREMGVQG